MVYVGARIMSLLHKPGYGLAWLISLVDPSKGARQRACLAAGFVFAVSSGMLYLGGGSPFLAAIHSGASVGWALIVAANANDAEKDGGERLHYWTWHKIAHATAISSFLLVTQLFAGSRWPVWAQHVFWILLLSGLGSTPNAHEDLKATARKLSERLGRVPAGVQP